MFCPNCGRELPNPDAAFCPFCGISLTGLMQEENETPDFAKAPESDRESVPVRRIRYDDPEDEEEPGRRKNISLILLLILAAVLVILLLFLNGDIRDKLFGGKGKEEPEEPPVQESVLSETEEEEEETREEPEEVSQGEVREEVTEGSGQEEEDQEETGGAEAAKEQEEVKEADDPDDSDAEKKSADTEGQIFPDSSSRVLSWSEINALTESQVQDAINEIFARRGYIFRDEKYRKYYESFSWYHGTTPADRFSEDIFTDIEKENVERLSKRRAELKG